MIWHPLRVAKHNMCHILIIHFNMSIADKPIVEVRANATGIVESDDIVLTCIATNGNPDFYTYT